jgi:hypothetical protein
MKTYMTVGRLVTASIVLVVFTVGSVLASNVTYFSSADQETIVKQQLSTPFEAVPFFVAKRYATEWETVIWNAETLPGHKHEVEARCNSPTALGG